MFYAQSTVTVILGCYTFCLYTVIVKNMYTLKSVYIQIFKDSLKKLKHKRKKTFVIDT